MAERARNSQDAITLEISPDRVGEKLAEWTAIGVKASHMGNILQWLSTGAKVSFRKAHEVETDSYLIHVSGKDGYESDIGVIKDEATLCEILGEFKEHVNVDEALDGLRKPQGSLILVSSTK